MRKIRVAVLGAGAIAQGSHLPGYGASENCELIAIADPQQSCLAEVREKYRFAREYADFRELLAAEKVDVVSVCLPNALHADAACLALEHGADVILEKPVSLTEADAGRIQAAVRRTGRKLAVCFSHRFNGLIRAAKEALDAGKIGEPYMIRIRFAHGGPYPGWAKSDWFYNPGLAGGGALLDMGIHAIDLAENLLGKIVAVSAVCGTLRKDIQLDDNASLLLRFERKAFGYLEVSWTSKAGFSGVEICGDAGAICVDYAAGETVLTAGAARPDGSFAMAKTVLARRGESAWKCQMAEFIADLVAERPFPCGIEEGIASLRVALGAYESNRTGREIRLSNHHQSAMEPQNNFREVGA